MAVELKKKDYDDKLYPFVAVSGGIMVNNPSGIGGGHIDDLRITRTRQVLARQAAPRPMIRGFCHEAPTRHGAVQANVRKSWLHPALLSRWALSLGEDM